MVDIKNAQNCDEEASWETTTVNGRRWENNKMDIREMGYVDGGRCGRWMELIQDHVQWWGLLLAVLNIRFLETFDISLRVSVCFIAAIRGKGDFYKRTC
jgi:hypothetical protein